MMDGGGGWWMWGGSLLVLALFVYDHHDHRQLDRVEEWTLVNASPMDHPFHLHVWPFQVVARSDGGSIPPG